MYITDCWNIHQIVEMYITDCCNVHHRLLKHTSQIVEIYITDCWNVHYRLLKSTSQECWNVHQRLLKRTLQIAEINSQGRQAYPHCPQSIKWLLMTWWQKETGHQYCVIELVILKYSSLTTRKLTLWVLASCKYVLNQNLAIIQCPHKSWQQMVTGYLQAKWLRHNCLLLFFFIPLTLNCLNK